MRGPPAMLDGGAILAAFHVSLGGGEDAKGRQRVHVRVQRDAEAACLDHPAERGGVAGLAMVEVQEQRRGRAAEAAVADPDVVDRAGGFGQAIPDAGRLQQAAGAGGDGVGAAVEGRMLHRRERRAVDHDGGIAGGGEAAGQRAADRAGADDADLGGEVVGHAAESGAAATVRQASGNRASAIRGFRPIVASAHEPWEPHGHCPSRRGDARLASPTIKALISQRSAELIGLALGLLGLALLVALACYDPRDPSLNTATSRHTSNLAGPVGAVLADLLLQGFGVAGALPGVAMLTWAWRIASRRGAWQHGRAAGRTVGRVACAGGGAGVYSACRRRWRGRRWRAWAERLGRCSRRPGSRAGREALGSVGAVLVWTVGAAFALTLTLLALGLSAGEWRAAGSSWSGTARAMACIGGRGAAGWGGVACVGCGCLDGSGGGRLEAGAVARREAPTPVTARVPPMADAAAAAGGRADNSGGPPAAAAAGAAKPAAAGGRVAVSASVVAEAGAGAGGVAGRARRRCRPTLGCWRRCCPTTACRGASWRSGQGRW